MRTSDLFGPLCVKSDRSRTSATVYDLSERQDMNGHIRRINTLKHENALLSRIIAETRLEIARLRKELESQPSLPDDLP